MISHRSADFQRLLGECSDQLRRVFRTTQPVLTLTGSGTAGVEASLLSLFEPGKPVITCASGRFGERWQDSADRAAAWLNFTNVRVSRPWGEPISPEDLEAQLRDHPNASVICLVHSETSTATTSDVRELTARARALTPDAMIVVDGVSSIGALPFEMDEWDVDAAVTGSQKALGLPPGLAFVALSPRAIERLRRTAVRPPVYLDLREYLAASDKGLTPYTPAVSLLYALREALGMLLEEGVEARWARTRRLAEATRDAIATMGLQHVSTAPSDAVTAAFYPPGVGDEVRQSCRESHGVELAGGQGPWKGRIFRLSHMGFISERDTLTGLEAIAEALRENNALDPADLDRGLAAAQARLGGTPAGQAG